MKIINKNWILGGALVLSPLLGLAQSSGVGAPMEPPKSNQQNSPYSMYGVGDWVHNGHTTDIGMGGAGISKTERGSLNLQNPAALVFLENITLDFAMGGNQKNFNIEGTTYKTGALNIKYLGLGLPFNKHFGAQLSFQPATNMYYFAQEDHNTNALGNYNITYRGEGGLNIAKISLAGQWKGLALGVDFGYLFGNFEKAKNLQSKDLNASFVNSAFLQKESVGGIQWGLGALYNLQLKNDHFLNIGLTAKVKQDFNVTVDHYNISSTVLGEQMLLDTLSSSVENKGSLTLPASYGLGLSYGKKDFWNVMLDANYTQWNEFSSLENRRGISNEAIGLRLGAQLSPKKDRDQLSYFHLMDYRVGVFYQQDYLALEEGQFQSIGAGIGVSLPIRRNYNYFAKVHLSLDAGQRKSNIGSLGYENFINFSVGVSLNDLWFVRPKYD